MRKIVVQTEISLDAVMEHPERWVFDYHNAETETYTRDLFFASDALVMGRVTYEGFAEFWPTRAGEDAFSDRMNSLPKYVASRTLKEPLTWNATLLKGDIAEAVATLKQQPGQNILQYGIGELTHTLIRHGLVDEFHFLLYPVAVGNGERIFDKIDKTGLKLLETKTFSSGVIALHYQLKDPQTSADPSA